MIELGFDDACRATKRDGTPCRIRATSLGFCIFHDPTPEERERRVRNSRAAGKASVRARRERAKRARALGQISLKGAEDAKALIESTINEIREGLLHTTRARLQIRAAQAILTHASTQEVAERLASLEELVEEYELQSPAAWQGSIEAKEDLRSGRRRSSR